MFANPMRSSGTGTDLFPSAGSAMIQKVQRGGSTSGGFCGRGAVGNRKQKLVLGLRFKVLPKSKTGKVFVTRRSQNCGQK